MSRLALWVLGGLAGFVVGRVSTRVDLAKWRGIALPEDLRDRFLESRTLSTLFGGWLIQVAEPLAFQLDDLQGGSTFEATDDPTASLREGKLRYLASGELDAEQTARLERLDLTLSPRDEMYNADGGVPYLGVGFSAVAVIDAALDAAGISDDAIHDVLDLPSGYGRVTRFLVDRFPQARCVASDLQPSALEFCRETFGVDTARSRQDFSKLDLGRRFDLIFCGSLFTHLREADAAALLLSLHDHLKPGGLAVVTTHGAEVDRRLREGETDLGLASGTVVRLLAEAEASGYAWAAYEGYADYGVSLSDADAVRRLAGLGTASSAEATAGVSAALDWREVLFLPKGWCLYQDVFVFERLDSSSPQRSHPS